MQLIEYTVRDFFNVNYLGSTFDLENSNKLNSYIFDTHFTSIVLPSNLFSSEIPFPFDLFTIP